MLALPENYANWGIGGQERCSCCKYPGYLPEPMDTDLLMDKKCFDVAFDEGSSIITVTLGGGNLGFSSINVLLALVFAFCILLAKEVVSRT